MTIRRAFYSSIAIVSRYPTETSGLLLFLVAFILVASNAVYFQHSSHPAPMWGMSQTDDAETSINKVIARTETVSSVNSVLSQPVSLTNIPVPTARPISRKSPSSRSSLVRDVQQGLAELGFYEGKVDGIFGTATRQAIISFETRAQMLPDGLASYKLLEKIHVAIAVSKRNKAETQVKRSIPNPVGQQAGQTNTAKVDETATFLDKTQTTAFDKETVSRIQTGLKKVFGEAEIEVDGIYGDQTKQAIMRFQQFFSMEATGQIDQKTMEKLLSTGIISAI